MYFLDALMALRGRLGLQGQGGQICAICRQK